MTRRGRTLAPGSWRFNEALVRQRGIALAAATVATLVMGFNEALVRQRGIALQFQPEQRALTPASMRPSSDNEG